MLYCLPLVSLNGKGGNKSMSGAKIADMSEAYGILMDAIVTQRLPPGQKVSENILSDMFGISRTIARNLIERLIAQQFLVSLSPRVTQVAPLTLLEIRQNFTLRKILLPEVISLAGVKVDFERVGELNKKVQSLLSFEGDEAALELLKTNMEINLALCSPAGYPLMNEWVTQLEYTAMRVYWLYIKTKNAFPYSNEQHSNLLEIMRSDEPRKIHALVYDLVAQTEERVLNAIFSAEQFYTQDLLV